MLVSLCNLAAGMAPNLGSSQTEDADMIIAVGNLKAVQVVNIVDCHERTIRRLRTNKRLFGNVKARKVKMGGREVLTRSWSKLSVIIYLESLI